MLGVAEVLRTLLLKQIPYNYVLTISKAQIAVAQNFNIQYVCFHVESSKSTLKIGFFSLLYFSKYLYKLNRVIRMLALML